MNYEQYIERYESWNWSGESFAVIDTLNDGQVVKIYKTSKACDNNVSKMNHDYNYN